MPLASQGMFVSPPSSLAGRHSGKGQIFTLLGAQVCALLLSGCSLEGAAAFEIAGAYFPGWMFCATLGILGGCLLRLLFIRLGLDERLPLKLFFYMASSLILTLLSWRYWFGPSA